VRMLGSLLLIVSLPAVTLAQANRTDMPGCYDPRPATCTARIAPCWSDYETVMKACKRPGTCSMALIAHVTADWNKVLPTCTHTGLPE
jgi:hypothetical protein